MKILCASLVLWLRCYAQIAYGSVALLMFACGGGANSPELSSASTSVAAGLRAEQSIGKGGGTVTLNTPDGSQFVLEVPAGALPSDLNLTLQTEVATEKERFVLKLAPAGLLFQSGMQGTLTIRLSPSLALPAAGGLLYDGVFLPVQRLSDGRLQVLLSGFADESLQTVASKLMQSLSLKQSLESAQASSVSLCGGVPQSLVGVDLAAIEAYGNCMLNAVNQLAQQGGFLEAAQAANATAALLQSAGSQQTSLVLNFINQASTVACTALRAKLDAAIQTSVMSMETYYPLIKPILFWQKIVEQLGAACSSVTPTEYHQVLRNKTDEALAYYNSHRPSITDIVSSAYTQARNEAKASQQALNEVGAVQPSLAMKNFVAEQIEQRAQPRLLEAMLHAPFKACKDQGSFAELIVLMQTMNSPPSVKNVAQYCGTSLNAQALDAGNSVTANLSPEMGGQINGQNISIQTNGNLQISTDGILRISGPIQALQCPVGAVGGSELLEIRLNGVLLQTLSTAPYLLNQLQLNIRQMLTAAGINANDFSSGNLTLLRTGSPCGGFWGDHPQPLLTLQLSAGGCVPAVGQEYCVTVIEIPNANYTTKPWRLSNTGQVLFRHERTGFVWKAGALRALPALFIPVDIADDGTVGGDQFENSTDSITHPSIVKPNATSSTHLATSVLRTGNPIDFPFYNPNAQYASFASLSAAGRATYRVGDEGYSTADLGFCMGSDPYYCWNYTYYESSAPNVGAGAPIRTDRLPSSQAGFTIQHDADSFGRVGNVGNGAGLSYGMKDFVQGTANTINWAIDKTGRVLVSNSLGSISETGQFNPPSAYLPADWKPIALGINSHALILKIGATAPQFRILNLSNGQLTATMDNPFTIRQAGHDIELTAGSYFSTRWIDGLGRVLVDASSPTQTNVRAAILTPRGVALP